MFGMAKKLGMHLPDEEIMERMGWGDASVLDKKWFKQQIRDANLQANLAAKSQAALLPIEAAKLQMQLGMQQAAMQQQGNQNGQNMPAQMQSQMQGFENAGGEGFNPAEGGQSPYEANPSATQTGMQ
jgi:hypothetical protein